MADIVASKKDQDTVARMFKTADTPQPEDQLELASRLWDLEQAAGQYLATVLKKCHPGRELSVSLTLFEQSLMMAEAAITRGPA